ncbi:MAG TPA: phosphoesterase [Bryobacteraceae bacterium]|nr:phosphoesterase [Bryobacteraceae bacterium]
MIVRVLYHDHCFDGAASAALFSRFMRGAFHPDAAFQYTGMAHRASQIFADSLFDGDVNAIVDFKYSSNPKLTWWFDHHQSAFLTPEDASHFRAEHSEKKMYDPAFKSCTNFISTMARQKWGFAAPDLDDLVHWANIIDGAQYSDPKTAVELGAPAMKLTLVIESSKGSDVVQRIIGYMQQMTLAEIVERPDIQELFKPLYDRHLKSLNIIRDRASESGGVITFDLTGCDLEGYNKFIPYYLYPQSTYTVSVSPSSFRTKISVGSNPWAPEEPRHNLASICERYGGGGHARVGAISLEPGQVDEARQVAAEIATELRT